MIYFALVARILSEIVMLWCTIGVFITLAFGVLGIFTNVESGEELLFMVLCSIVGWPYFLVLYVTALVASARRHRRR